MYKTSTFITSLFSQFRVRDSEIRKAIVTLYRPLIDTVLNDVSPVKRVLIFKELLPSVHVTIMCLQQLKVLDPSDPIYTTVFRSLKSNITFSFYLIKKVGIRSDSSGAFFDIMKQVNLDDIACDIGKCVQLLKETTDDEDHYEINAQLEVLLNDYNVVTGQSLTVDEVLKKK